MSRSFEQCVHDLLRKNTLPIRDMSEPEERYVCDLTLIMRARLLCGLYNKRSVPPRWRRLAQAYCVIVPVAISIAIYFASCFVDVESGFILYWIPALGLYYLAVFVSLWTEDEYIYKYFSQNELTDVTLDSTSIFRLLRKQMEQAFYKVIAFYVIYMGLDIALYFKVLFVFEIPSFLLDLLLAFSSSAKIIIMALFDARMLVLKRRLQRYGFRTVGRARSQPYCQIYDEILQDLDATDNPLKLLIFFDLIINCWFLIFMSGYYVIFFEWQNILTMPGFGQIPIAIMALTDRFFKTFGHVTFLESAAAHCDDMAIFTVTQLIKAPTTEQRRRIRDFLGALERRGARYQLLRALPVDARFALRVLSFCTAQIILLITVLKERWNTN